MAARAYFRKGDADLPSRGVFRHNGAQRAKVMGGNAARLLKLNCQ